MLLQARHIEAPSSDLIHVGEFSEQIQLIFTMNQLNHPLNSASMTYEPAYHDVHVEPICAAVQHSLSFRGQIGEVRGQHRRRYLCRSPHLPPLFPR